MCSDVHQMVGTPHMQMCSDVHHRVGTPHKKMCSDVHQRVKIKKESHSKVKNIKHTKYEIQNYLKASQLKITQEEAREIFKLRCRVTDVKANYKGKYENIDCQECHEEENQKHIINCKLLNKDENEKLPEYEEILKSNAATQLQIAKKFMKNMKIRKKS